MSPTRAVETGAAPPAIGPYSQGVWAGDLFFTAGQIGLDPATGDRVEGGVEAETDRALRNLAAVLAAAGLALDDVVKTTVFVADLAEFETVNRVYGAFFEEPYPARSTVQVARLPRDAAVEIEAVARRG